MKNLIIAVEEHANIAGQDIYCKTVNEYEPMSMVEYLAKGITMLNNFKKYDTTHVTGLIEYQLILKKVNRFGEVVKKSRIA